MSVLRLFMEGTRRNARAKAERLRAGIRLFLKSLIDGQNNGEKNENLMQSGE